MVIERVLKHIAALNHGKLLGKFLSVVYERGLHTRLPGIHRQHFERSSFSETERFQSYASRWSQSMHRLGHAPNCHVASCKASKQT